MRRRLFAELALAAASGCLLVLTVVSNDWIERAFRIDPDAGSGAVEWILTAAAVTFTIVFTALAAAEFRRPRASRR